MELALKTLQGLNFHDSEIVRVELKFQSGRNRSAVLDLNYYDWEGNSARRKVDPASRWATRALRIQFGYIAVFEYLAEDIINSAHEVNTVEWGQGLDELIARERGIARRFSGYKSPMLENSEGAVSMRFETQNCSDERMGYFMLIGTNVAITWDGFPSNGEQTLSL